MADHHQLTKKEVRMGRR
ncbi:unnamed protein product, partial [Vitis vinifera]|uniref:Uncharacterized protein n=1 Tax=Vitis vinifera TaxID=29760 RepID=D7SUG7_VITVI